jgi:hypothetical protein
LIGKSQRKKLFGRHWDKEKHNVKIGLKETDLDRFWLGAGSGSDSGLDVYVQ